jgi:hypothetical protein
VADRAATLALLAVHASTAEDPVLDAAALDAVLALAQLWGDDPSVGQVANYDVPGAVVLAWEAKAGLAANRTQVGRGGTSVARHQTAQACLAQAAVWRRRITRGVGVPTTSEGESVEAMRVTGPVGAAGVAARIGGRLHPIPVASGVLYPEQQANVSEAAAEAEVPMPRRSPTVSKLIENVEGHQR